MIVCGICGILIGVKASGGYVHLDAIPKEFDYHEAGIPTDPEKYAEAVRANFDIRLIGEEMLEHHMTLHPLTDCEWSQRLAMAIRKR